MNSQKFDQLAEEYPQALAQAVFALESIDALLEKECDLDAPMDEPMRAALEDISTGMGIESFASSARKAISIVVAIVRRMIDTVIDFLRSEQHSARRCIDDAEKIVKYIGTLDPNATAKRDVTNMATMMMISYEGHFSRYLTKALDVFYATAIDFRKHVPTREISALVSAVRAGREPSMELERFHDKLQEGLKALGTTTDVKSSAVYSNLDPGRKVYTTSRMFGDRFIFGQISEIKDGTFSYSCTVKRDATTRMRIKSFPAIKPNDIALCAKIIRLFCEDFLRNLDVESDLFKINRDVAQLERSDGNRAGIKALRAVASSIQNVYVVYTRHAMSVTRNMLNYLHDASRAYG